MKKILAICIALLLVVCIPTVSAEDAPADFSVSGGCNTIDGGMPLLGSQPILSNAKAMLLYETNTDTLMYAYNADEQLPPSSLLKILTALIAIEKGNLADVVTVRQDVLDTLAADAAVVELVPDEVVTVKDLLYCMMVGSGNDAAVVLADHVMGSQQAFVAEMNAYVAALGCTGTNFTNVHGLHDKDQYTTARDVGKILAKAVKNEQFCEIFKAKYYSVPATNKADERHLATQNYLVNNDKDISYFDERVTGSRTGAAYDRSRHVASVASVNDLEMICVVMGSQSQYEKDGYSIKVYGGYNETKRLLDLGSAGYKPAQILFPDQVVQQRSVVNGDCDVMIGTRSGAASVIPDNVPDNGLEYRYVDEISMTAPIEKGQTVATMQVWCGGVCVGQTELYAMNRVRSAGTQFEDNRAAGNGPKPASVILYLLGAVVSIILLGVVALCVLRATRIAKAKRQSRRHRRNRRRSR